MGRAFWRDSVQELHKTWVHYVGRKGERMKFPEVRSEREIDMIRGKMLVAAATAKELQDFLVYVQILETLVDQASNEDFYGTEGWRHLIGWDED